MKIKLKTLKKVLNQNSIEDFDRYGITLKYNGELLVIAHFEKDYFGEILDVEKKGSWYYYYYDDKAIAFHKSWVEEVMLDKKVASIIEIGKHKSLVQYVGELTARIVETDELRRFLNRQLGGQR